eukprot:TRINITY_DN5736_c0_g1_i1.p1 TRINITY_DN5736_c0_g1~~TRINITY_DN5736_c0_g1_i1.p1  ORF type:complete len:115 (-),score=18.54 TRINITY_DN5736_c0_g1_i1:262-606(-)
MDANNGSRRMGTVVEPLKDGCYRIMFDDKPGEEIIPQKFVNPNVEKDQFVILVIGLAKHGKTSTLKTIFGKDFEGSEGSSNGKVDIIKHHKSDKLIFLDAPGISISDPNFSDKN